MKKTTILIFLALMAFAPMAWAQFSGGNGLMDNPYLISHIDDWNQFVTYINSGNTNFNSKYYKLTADITVSETVDSGAPVTMAGNSETNSFKGTFDGNGKTLTVHYSDNRSGGGNENHYCGPFRFINGATIKNLHVTGETTRKRKSMPVVSLARLTARIPSRTAAQALTFARTLTATARTAASWATCATAPPLSKTASSTANFADATNGPAKPTTPSSMSLPAPLNGAASSAG